MQHQRHVHPLVERDGLRRVQVRLADHAGQVGVDVQSLLHLQAVRGAPADLQHVEVAAVADRQQLRVGSVVRGLDHHLHRPPLGRARAAARSSERAQHQADAVAARRGVEVNEAIHSAVQYDDALVLRGDSRAVGRVALLPVVQAGGADDGGRVGGEHGVDDGRARDAGHLPVVRLGGGGDSGVVSGSGQADAGVEVVHRSHGRHLRRRQRVVVHSHRIEQGGQRRVAVVRLADVRLRAVDGQRQVGALQGGERRAGLQLGGVGEELSVHVHKPCRASSRHIDRLHDQRDVVPLSDLGLEDGHHAEVVLRDGRRRAELLHGQTLHQPVLVVVVAVPRDGQVVQRRVAGGGGGRVERTIAEVDELGPAAADGQLDDQVHTPSLRRTRATARTTDLRQHHTRRVGARGGVHVDVLVGRAGQADHTLVVRGHGRRVGRVRRQPRVVELADADEGSRVAREVGVEDRGRSAGPQGGQHLAVLIEGRLAERGADEAEEGEKKKQRQADEDPHGGCKGEGREKEGE